jgi:diguanylate cyclase (GGDEF)-like protein/PAS domain S-box-containing protein
MRAWLAIVAVGAGALAWAVSRLSHLDSAELAPALTGIALVALAGSFALKIPRSNHSFTAADIFTFTILATLGTPVAVLAAGLESAIGTWRTSKRLTSRLSSPAATMAAMAMCGASYAGLQDALIWLGLGPLTAALTALCAVSQVPFLLTSIPLRAMMSLKRGEPMRPREWLADSSWWAAMYLGAAFVAGLVVLNAQRFGPAVLAIAAAIVLGLVLLLRMALRRQEAERQAQESLVAAAQREAELSQQRFTAAFTHAAIGMAITRRGGKVLQVNRSLCTLLGRTEDELVGQPFSTILPDGDLALLRRQLRDDDEPPDEPFSMELRCVASDGSELWVVLHCSRYEDPGGAGHCLIYQIHDITSRHVAESRLHHIAYHDGLTDLGNRTCFHERLEVAVERSRLDAKERFAVLFLDLDRFKIVNDSLGHIAGNDMLRDVARRLRSCVRPIDLVARLGGDEFAILLEGLTDPEAGMRLAHRVLDAVGQPLLINGTEIVPSASVGITFSDLGYRTVDEVLRDADLAMYAAKGNGRGRVALFDSSMHEKVAERLALEADLRRAIGEGQLSVHFQPLYELEPYRLYGFEALARWVHPQRGPISPAVFIALAEESGHIEALTDWVIEYSVAKLAMWRRAAPATGRLGVHVNISGRDLARASLVWHVQDVLSRHDLPPQCLTLEITETTLMGRLEIALQNINELRQIGVGFSIDDFGTGYSSLAYLSTLPIESLKIDRSFVIGLNDNPQNVEIVRAVQTLGRSLGRKIIAEGIETPEQLATLRALGVPIGQGYLLSRPLRENQVEELLAIAESATIF